MSDTLRHNLIRLASEHPEFRKDLLPLLREAASSPKVISEAAGAAEAYIDLVGEVMDKLDVIQGYAKLISRVEMQSFTGDQIAAEIWSAPLDAKRALQKGVSNATRLTTSLLAGVAR